MEASALQLALADTVTCLHRATGGSGGNGRLNAVPLPELPPNRVVPYRVLFVKITPPIGLAPPPPAGKLDRVVKPVPSVWTANPLPQPEQPPVDAVPCMAFT